MTSSQPGSIQPIIKLLKGSTSAGRLKVDIPFPCKAEREAFKKLNSTFYHPTQRLWSIANTADNLRDLKRLFGERLVEVTTEAMPALPKVALNAHGQEELDRNHQKMVLKGFSASTIRNYQHALQRFFQFFSNTDLPTLTKSQIEGFVYQMVTKYRMGDQAQNTLINAINPVGFYKN